MDFVKSLSMFHVDAKEIPCVTGNGAPTEKTEGAPGALYMDTLTGELYKCRAADLMNEVFTWEAQEGSGYKLPIGGEQLGGVKNGGNVTINADGTDPGESTYDVAESPATAEVSLIAEPVIQPVHEKLRSWRDWLRRWSWCLEGWK